MAADIYTNVSVNDHGAIARLEAFPELQKVAIMRAVNKTLAWCKTRTIRSITTKLAIKKSDLTTDHRFGNRTTKAIKVVKSSGHGGGSMTVTGGRIPLIFFGAKPATPPNPFVRKPVGYEILQGGRRTIYGNMFVAQMKSGHIGIFRRQAGGPRVKMVAKSGKRKGKMIMSQVGLAQDYGPSIPEVARTDPTFEAMLKVDAGERLEMEMGRAVEFLLTGKGLESLGGDDEEGD